MRDLHLVYPHADRISCPDAIGRHLGELLASSYRVHLHDWDDTGVISPGRGAVLLGHPHPSPRTVFRRSLERPGWSRRLILAPYNHGDLRQCAWLDPLVERCDLFLALTGDHWFRSIEASAFRHWAPKMVQLHLAVDPDEFPPIKTSFNLPGERRFLFIGHSTWTKNVSFLAKLAAVSRPGTIYWMGTGPPVPHVVPLGLQDFSLDETKASLATFDFVLSVGRADANPASVLEGMAWGLIPVCSIETAHADLPGIVTLPIDDEHRAALVLEQLQTRDERDLLSMQAANRSSLDALFRWDRLVGDVRKAIESGRSPDLGRATLGDRSRIGWARLSSPYGWWRPGQMLEEARRRLRSTSS